MKATIESTDKIVDFDGIPTRVWEGTTDSGIKIQCFITRVATSADETRLEEFEKELLQCKPPSEETRAIPLRLKF